jgi:O-antigen/teichoic acid export membrane protein
LEPATIQSETATATLPLSGTTDGMTSKVMKGSFWVLMGQLVPLIATFIASPFVIRYLGSEAYGVLLLIAMIPTYFTFGDFGMGLASTKFGSEAYGEKSAEKEAAIIRTAAYIALISASVIAVPLFIFSPFIIIDIFYVPAKYSAIATMGLRIACIGYVFNTMTSVFNTPQLSRLKMNLNVLVTAGPRVLMTCLTPFVLYLGGGILGATVLAAIITIIVFTSNILVSVNLLPQLKIFSIDKAQIKPLMKFGKGVILYGAAFMLIFNLEKIMLPRLTEDPKQLAYYSIAYTLANMTTMFTLAIGQTLVPAFSQMLAPEKKGALNLLFSRSFRGCLLLLLPVTMFLIVIAQPFFNVWAGPEFGRESIIPFYILMGGIFFSLLMYLPNTILLANGRTDLFAKTYWIEILPYLGLAWLLISQFGIAGAALAWSVREICNAILFYWFSKKYTKISYDFSINYTYMSLAVVVLVMPVIFARSVNNFSVWLLLIVPVAILLYLAIAWKHLITEEERVIVKNKMNPLFKKIGLTIG